VRRRTSPARPATRPQKVANAGAVKHGRSTISRFSSEAGRFNTGSIGGFPRHEVDVKHRRCFRFHLPRSRTNTPNHPACHKITRSISTSQPMPAGVHHSKIKKIAKVQALHRCEHDHYLKMWALTRQGSRSSSRRAAAGLRLLGATRRRCVPGHSASSRALVRALRYSGAPEAIRPSCPVPRLKTTSRWHPGRAAGTAQRRWCRFRNGVLIATPGVSAQRGHAVSR
jgi:hypothetical protein